MRVIHKIVASARTALPLDFPPLPPTSSDSRRPQPWMTVRSQHQPRLRRVRFSSAASTSITYLKSRIFCYSTIQTSLHTGFLQYPLSVRFRCRLTANLRYRHVLRRNDKGVPSTRTSAINFLVATSALSHMNGTEGQ